MNKYIVGAALMPMIGLFLGCANKYESVFDKSADERVRELLTLNRVALVSAENGWNGYIDTELGGRFYFFFDFDDNGDVVMVSDFNLTTANTPFNGTFLMKALQRPTLSFDTYSYVHYLVDPDGTVNNGPIGVGLGSDFEFAFEDRVGDTLQLEGLQRNTAFYLVEATASERAAILNGDLGTTISSILAWDASTQFTYIDLDGEIVSLGINPDNKTFTIFRIVNNEVVQSTVPYTYSLNGIQLVDESTILGFSFDELTWSDIQGTLIITDGADTYPIESTATPITFNTLQPPLESRLGTEVQTITIDTSNTKIKNSVEFNDLFDQTAELMFSQFSIELAQVVLEFPDDQSVIINYDFLYFGNLFSASILYDLNITGGIVAFVPTGFQNGNADIVEDTLVPLRNYFESHTWTFLYVPDPSSGSLLIEATPEEDAIYFYGGIN